ncbi:MAG: hypothetical protein ACXABD_04455 [Candidatus Thorarchaeota archaeon]|jgi:hypothetical protein
MSEILEAVRLRLQFDNTGEFKEALLQLLQGRSTTKPNPDSGVSSL